MTDRAPAVLAEFMRRTAIRGRITGDRYTCAGLGSGRCGKVHDTPEQAARCIADAGDNDRRVCIVPG